MIAWIKMEELLQIEEDLEEHLNLDMQQKVVAAFNKIGRYILTLEQENSNLCKLIEKERKDHKDNLQEMNSLLHNADVY